MADAAVEFLLENLTQLLLHHAHLIIDAKDKVEKLETDLRFFKAFLRDSTKKRKKDDRLRDLVRSIRDVVYEAEDIIDAFVTQAAVAKSRSYFGKAFSSPAKLLDIAGQVESICGKIRDFKGGKDNFDFAILDIGDDGPETALEVPIVRKDNIVGLEDEAEKLIGYLNDKTEQLDVISIIGMPGLGKTTLAAKIFDDPALQFEFPTRIWVYVSQEFTSKNVFLAILKKMITKLSDEMYAKSDVELAQEVASRLEGGKFLIVMDDVWTAQDWDKLKIAFPSNARMGKVLITSRQQEVALAANRKRPPHKMRHLDEAESWLLFQWEVFGKPECPSVLEVSGKLIVEGCHRLPLAIVVIGGILATKFAASDDLSVRRDAWEKVSQSVSVYLKDEDPLKRMEAIIALSYDKLPYHLKECFLYLGMFPEDFEIPVWNLTRMWIAEGLIQPKDGVISIEEIAENYLDELINRNLVRIDKRKANGKVKTCRIHDLLRDFCKTIAGNERENFLQEIKNYGGVFQPLASDISKYRRLCIHSNVVNFLSKRPKGSLVRSFVCFSKEEFDLQNDTISAIPAAFKLLRVLEVKPIRFPKIPGDLYHLVHLRYITLSLNSASNTKPTVLPAAFSKLWNIQTLIIDTASRTLDIRADILNMIQLRHLKTNASATLIKPGKASKEGDMLQTLGTISTESCTEALIVKARNLKKLGVRGNLALLMDPKSGSFDSLRKLGSLENLKLINDAFPHPSKLGDLPPSYRFPKKLRSLTLSSTLLDWTDMSILGSLENLLVLKLKDKAFMGRSWEAADAGFRRLEVLHIGHTNLAVWVALGHHFPRLRCLKLRNCENLEGVPIGLADIPTFQELDLFRTEKAAASAKKIRKNRTTNGLTEFKLFIFPPSQNDL
ncbi:hypothetical protein ABFS82_04G131500 [Erythranthe guttata]|uniref:NB-ARC domain-containing protein n=1 Tax=Erythranthe guttata TaxID=4155 RepID=A0A022Q950_ERYGU|nr:PREDICTED: disease resistance RPP8-like protein 3 [Erythranthe guttata]EYU24144.1 hypothetical protein MIMGU_mgv1a001094mg [Erythranthe guttata]|eukprot:XP_012853200.1 PREDICTED: disease resistance RPP8-like protein 3 [Erythranthe guttata]